MPTYIIFVNKVQARRAKLNMGFAGPLDAFGKLNDSGVEYHAFSSGQTDLDDFRKFSGNARYKKMVVIGN
jgi:hypothetical protein